MAHRTDEQLVAAFAVARDRGDEQAMRRVWRELVVRLHPRLTYFAQRFAPGGDRTNGLRGAELDDAVARAGVRLAFSLVRTFRGVSMGELVNATKQLTLFACLDVFEERVRDERRTVRADEPGEDDAGTGRHDAAIGAALRAELERREAQAELVLQVDAAFATITNPKHREVLELDRLGVPDPEIAEQLGISLPNVYARRSRGLKALRGAFDA